MTSTLQPRSRDARRPHRRSATRRRLAAGAAALAAAAVLAACTSSGGAKNTDSSGAGSGTPAGGSSRSATAHTLTVGTTDKVFALDPAGSFDAGSGTVESQVYAALLDRAPGSSVLKPNLATSYTLTDAKTYTVKLKPGLKFANGDTLTSTDVKFSYDRQLKIADPNGPSSLLFDLASVDAPDPTTVIFHLKSANDQTFPQILALFQIVDHQVFSATKVTPDATIIAKKPFDGPYTISSYQANQLVQFQANPQYQGVLGTPGFSTLNLKFYASADNLKLDLQQGNIDLASRTLSITDIDSLRKQSGLSVYNGAATGFQYFVFNFKTQPYGTTTSDASPAKALAVRQAVADVIDRQAISQQVYKGTEQPVYTFLPSAVPSGQDVLKPLYGDGNGGPDVTKAKSTLQAAGVTGPVTLQVEYNTDHYGEESADEFALIKSQLEATGLFKVNLQSTLWTEYGKQRVADAYPEFQLGWYADYLDAQDFYQPLYGDNGFINNHFEDAALQALIIKQATTHGDSARAALSVQIQHKLAQELPIIPLLQISTTVVADKVVGGVQAALATGGLPLAALKPAS